MDGTARTLRERDGDSDELVLAVLDAVERDHQLTQRSVAQELGIALGLANAYLKRCVRKGLIKVQQVPRRRYAYYLTPQGFSEKSRLTASYLAHSFSFFRRARMRCGEQFALARGRGWRRVALYGAGDLAEIAMLCAREHDVELIGIVDPDHRDRHFLGLPVVAAASDLGAIDAAIVVDVAAPQRARAAAIEALGTERVLVPDILRIPRTPPASLPPTTESAP